MATSDPNNMTSQGAKWEWDGIDDETAVQLTDTEDFNCSGTIDTSKLRLIRKIKLSLAKKVTIFAKHLTLTGAQWRWYEANDEEIAELITGKDFNIHGKFETCDLLPLQTYEVSFQIMMKNDAMGFDVPVKLELYLPKETPIRNNENLSGKPMNSWVDIKVSTFKTGRRMSGEMKFSMYQFGDQLMKKGLVIKSATICPV